MEQQILNLLVDLCEDEIVKEDQNVELFDSGLLDSLAFTELLVRIEDELGITIAPSEVEREEMNTPSKIISQVKLRS